ncbi:MAG TPA: O-methyltransferase [Candidatus Dormibacteraeota bacterium]|jgi:caffeoyl-CoA O-methyltransferase|nr:O-methyltransferase [Candidatus Dormibacteraeota bacterium]
MSPKSFLLNEAIHRYIVDHSMPLDDVQRSLIAETAALGDVSGMQIAPEQGAFLTLITAALNVRSAVEVGTFTGYSALCIARGLADGGRLICCDVSEEWTAIGRRHWAAAGVDGRIDLRIAPASETLRSLDPSPTIDIAFIDADKRGYRDYAEQLIPRLRPGGLLLVDNVLWSGRVIEADADGDANAAHIRAFNDWLVANDAVDTVMLPISDGLTMARRR